MLCTDVIFWTIFITMLYNNDTIFDDPLQMPAIFLNALKYMFFTISLEQSSISVPEAC